MNLNTFRLLYAHSPLTLPDLPTGFAFVLRGTAYVLAGEAFVIVAVV